MTYIVTFEIKGDDKIAAITTKLRSYGIYCPIHNNAWAVSVEKTAVEIRDELVKLIGPHDRLFVVRSGVEAAWVNTYGEKNSEWLKERL